MFLLLTTFIFLKMNKNLKIWKKNLTSCHTKTDHKKKIYHNFTRNTTCIFNIQLIKQVFWSSIALTLNFPFICYAPSKKINPLQNINNVILNAYLIPLIYYFLKHCSSIPSFCAKVQVPRIFIRVKNLHQ